MDAREALRSGLVLCAPCSPARSSLQYRRQKASCSALGTWGVARLEDSAGNQAGLDRTRVRRGSASKEPAAAPALLALVPSRGGLFSNAATSIWAVSRWAARVCPALAEHKRGSAQEVCEQKQVTSPVPEPTCIVSNSNSPRSPKGQLVSPCIPTALGQRDTP